MENKFNMTKLHKVQRMCCLSTSEAMRTTPTSASETILNILAIEIQIRYEAAFTSMTPKSLSEWIKGLRIHIIK